MEQGFNMSHESGKWKSDGDGEAIIGFIIVAVIVIAIIVGS